MKCPHCNADSDEAPDGTQFVVSSRTDSNNRIRRRRQCFNCNQRFSTLETIKLDSEVVNIDELIESEIHLGHA